MTQASEAKLWWWQWLAIVGRVAKQHGEPRRTVMPRADIETVNVARRLEHGLYVEEEAKRGPNRKARRAKTARARGKATC